jgi:hypothetical protein
VVDVMDEQDWGPRKIRFLLGLDLRLASQKPGIGDECGNDSVALSNTTNCCIVHLFIG